MRIHRSDRTAGQLNTQAGNAFSMNEIKGIRADLKGLC
jgi:hypothetical protein